MIPSFTGDGMSIALYSGIQAAESLLRGETAAVFQRKLHAALRWQVWRATAISRALVWGPSKRLLVGTVRLWPELMRGMAVVTRVDGRSLASAVPEI